MTPRTLLLPAVGIAAALLSAASSAHAHLLFADDFDTTAQNFDINFEIDQGRQTGSLGVISYLDTDSSSGGYRTQVNESSFPDALFLFPDGGGDGQQQYASPNFNFDAYGAQLNISMRALNQGMEGGDYIGFDIGGNNALDLPFGGSGFGLVLRPHLTGVGGGANNYEIYSGGTLLASGNSAAVLANSNFLSVSISASEFDGTPAAVELQINGATVFSDTLAGGFTDNFITLGAASFSGDNEFYGFDNLSVSVVPEPASAAMLALGGLVLGLRRRRA